MFAAISVANLGAPWSECALFFSIFFPLCIGKFAAPMTILILATSNMIKHVPMNYATTGTYCRSRRVRRCLFCVTYSATVLDFDLHVRLWGYTDYCNGYPGWITHPLKVNKVNKFQQGGQKHHPELIWINQPPFIDHESIFLELGANQHQWGVSSSGICCIDSRISLIRGESWWNHFGTM